jgi:hypothetical protein
VKRCMTMLLVLLVLGLFLQPASAQTSDEPALVVSISGVESVAQAVEQVGAAAGFEMEAQMYAAMAVESVGEAGIDATQPWGLILSLEGETPSGLAFIPIDLDLAMAQLKGMVEKMQAMGGDSMQMGPVPVDISAIQIPDPDADGIYEIKGDEGPSLYIGGQDGWAFASIDRDLVLNAPADPTPLLGDLPSKYAIGVTLNPQQIPPEAFDALNGLFMMAMMSAEIPPELLEQQQKQIEDAVELLKDMAQDVESATFGLAAEADGALRIDIDMICVPGSDIDSTMSKPAAVATRFAGFCDPNATLCFNQKTAMLPAQVAQMEGDIEELRSTVVAELATAQLSDADRLMLEKMINDGIDTLLGMLQQEVIEGAGSVNISSTSVSIAAAATVPDAAKLEEIIIQLLGIAGQEEPELAAATAFNVDEYKGVRMHTISVPAMMLMPQADPMDLGPPMDPMMQTLMLSQPPQGGLPPALADGTITALLGFSDDAVYAVLTLGDAVAELKAAIDASETADVDPTVLQTMSISMAQLGDAFELAGMPLDMVLPGYVPSADDSITVEATYADAQSHSEVRISAGMISLISRGAQIAAAQASAAFEEGFDQGFEMGSEYGEDPFGEDDDTLDPFEL